MKVKLTYFKRSGKFYSSGEYYTGYESMIDIWEEAERMLNNRVRPGLCDGENEFIVLIQVPEHPDNHSKLII